jgi:hypothetical protein
MLATRNAMQILLATHLMFGNAPQRGEERALAYSDILNSAALAASKLPKFDGKWVRLYDYDVPSTPPPPSTQPSGPFEKVAPPVAPSLRTDTFGLDAMIDDARSLEDAGREKFRTALAANFTPNLRAGG